MPDVQTGALQRLRRDLEHEYYAGRRQRLWSVLSGGLRALLESLATGEDARTQVAGYLLTLATLVHAARRTDVAERLTLDLPRVLTVDGPAAEYLDPDVGRTYVLTQAYRTQAVLPGPLAGGNAQRLSRLATDLNTSLAMLPAELWDAALLASYRPTKVTRGGLVLVVPPATELSGAQSQGLDRPPSGPQRPELVAATPVGATVVDAAAERLWYDEALAAILNAAPTTVAVWWDPDVESGPRDRLLADLTRLLPRARLAAVVPGDQPVAGEGFAHQVLGPPFTRLADLLPPGEALPRVLPAGAPPPLADPTPWPLACYRPEATDADLLLPVEGRDGAQLARDLVTCRACAPAARRRLVAGLTAAQAGELAMAMPRPEVPHWGLELTTPALPADAGALRLAGLRSVLLRVADGAIPLSLLAPVAMALRQVGIQPWVEVTATDGDPGPVITELAAAQPAAVAFHGDLAPVLWEQWLERLKAAG